MKNFKISKKIVGVGILLATFVVTLTGCKANLDNVITIDKDSELNIKAEIIENSSTKADNNDINNNILDNEQNVNANTVKPTTNDTKDKVNIELFAKLWENEYELTELQINKDGTFLIDHYNLASQMVGTYTINGMKMNFTNKDGGKWQGELVKQNGIYMLNINYNNENIILYDLSEKPAIKELYEFNDGCIFYNLCLYDNGTYKYEHCIWASEGELGEYTINGNVISLKAHYGTGSDIGVEKIEKTMNVIMNTDGTISDKNNIFKYTEDCGLDAKYKDFNFGNIIMKKTDSSKKEQYLKTYPSIQAILSRAILN